MTLPRTRGDREYQKFTTDSAGNVAVRVANEIIDDDGDKVEVDTSGRLYVLDYSAQTELRTMKTILEDIRFQLQLITGAEIHE